MKFYILSLFVAYVVYLISYKCVQLRETPLEHAVGEAFHPWTHTHNFMCDSLYKGESIVMPYVNTAKTLFNTHVVSHPALKSLDIESKYSVALKQYYTHVYPVVLEVFKVIEFYERMVLQFLAQLYDRVSNLYNEKTKKL